MDLLLVVLVKVLLGIATPYLVHRYLKISLCLALLSLQSWAANVNVVYHNSSGSVTMNANNTIDIRISGMYGGSPIGGSTGLAPGGTSGAAALDTARNGDVYQARKTVGGVQSSWYTIYTSTGTGAQTFDAYWDGTLTTPPAPQKDEMTACITADVTGDYELRYYRGTTGPISRFYTLEKGQQICYNEFNNDGNGYIWNWYGPGTAESGYVIVDKGNGGTGTHTNPPTDTGDGGTGNTSTPGDEPNAQPPRTPTTGTATDPRIPDRQNAEAIIEAINLASARADTLARANKAKLDEIENNTDGLEANTADLDSNTDGIEGLLTAGNAKLDTLIDKAEAIRANADFTESEQTSAASSVISGYGNPVSDAASMSSAGRTALDLTTIGIGTGASATIGTVTGAGTLPSDAMTISSSLIAFSIGGETFGGSVNISPIRDGWEWLQTLFKRCEEWGVCLLVWWYCGRRFGRFIDASGAFAQGKAPTTTIAGTNAVMQTLIWFGIRAFLAIVLASLPYFFSEWLSTHASFFSILGSSALSGAPALTLQLLDAFIPVGVIMGAVSILVAFEIALAVFSYFKSSTVRYIPA